MWRYRELFLLLCWREVAVRYKQALLGVGWAVVQPVVTMLVFTVVFGQFMKLPSDGVPYPVFVYSALLPWSMVSSALLRISGSVTGNSGLVSKVYFPRVMIPGAALAPSLLDFCVSFIILLGMMLATGMSITPSILVVPLLMLLAALVTLAVGLWLAALNVRYRDVQYAVPFLIQVWMFASPVAYSTSAVPSGTWATLYSLNPLVGLIQAFRWALLGTELPGQAFLISLAGVAFLLLTGAYYFGRTSDTFADVI